MPSAFWAAILAVCTCMVGLASGLEGHSQSVIVDGSWRFTAMTQRVIRLEYDEAKQFVDEPTEAFLRSPPTGVWESQVAGDSDWSVLQTKEVVVKYMPKPAPTIGSVVMVSRSNNSYVWRWGDDPAVGNLRGTARTLDSSASTLDLNCNNKVSPTMDNSEMHCTWGLVSKLGWAAVNETGMPTWRDGWYAPSRNTTDVSIFLHGHDFAGALRDFAYVAGPPALPPRYSMGTIFTRWFDFDEDSAAALIDEFEARSMPMDAWIFDMNWHVFGPWGSFTWNKGSYPNLQSLLDSIQARGLFIGANTHDHDGIRPEEATYKQFCNALGRAPCKDTIEFDLYNRTYAMAQEDVAWRALQTKGDQQGLDFAWIDYQQGETDIFQRTKIPKLNPTIVLNRLRSTDAARHNENKRPLILSRWGGLGNHRYPLGFSGDQMHNWEGLAFLPYFTSTAANVAYGFWSHDTVGGDHSFATDYEFSVRWVQTSAWSPVFRFHDKGAGTGDCATLDECARVIPWDVPTQFYDAIRLAAQDRDELLPYIYTAAFSSVSTGRVLTCPMYYEDPTDQSLYGLDKQYLFGSDMIISPISSASSSDAKGFAQALGAIEWAVYAPRTIGGWVDRMNGDFVRGDWTKSVYGIRDTPSLARQGAVIPMRPPRTRGESSIARARQQLQNIEFRIMPAEAFYRQGSFAASGSVIDDDGLTMDYLTGKFANTTCSYTFHGGRFQIKLAQTGDFEGRPTRQTVKLSFPQLPPLKYASVATRPGANLQIAYDRKILGPTLSVPDVDLSASSLSIEATFDDAYSPKVMPNLVGLLGRVRRARYAKDALDAANVNYGESRANLTSVVLAGAHMSADFVANLPQLWEGAEAQVSKLLQEDKTLQKDLRRKRFIALMMQLTHDGSAHVNIVI